MKIFKIFDCFLSLFLIISSSIGLVNERSAITAWAGLFAIGVWHIISMLIHYFVAQNNSLFRIRSFYHYTAMAAIIPIIYLMSISLPGENLPRSLLLVILPSSMAFFYTGLCLFETINLFRHENK
ncbi:hypothetical protein JMG10_27840 [Nostoc ellipsosporum NOK]|nr:hypothetical protein [Nostoc ellipsosporum NOK]